MPSIQAHHISLRPCHLNFHSFQIGHHTRSLVTIKHDKNILIIVNPLTLAAVAFPINQNDWMPAKFLFFLSRTPRRRSLPMMFWGVKLQTLNFVFFSLSLSLVIPVGHWYFVWDWYRVEVHYWKTCYYLSLIMRRKNITIFKGGLGSFCWNWIQAMKKPETYFFCKCNHPPCLHLAVYLFLLNFIHP